MRTAKFPLLAMHGVLQKSVKFIKWKYIASLCAYDGGNNAWPTRCNVSRERSTLRVPLSSVLPHEKRLWNSYLCNNSIGFDVSRCMWKFVVYRGQHYIHFTTQLNLEPKYAPYTGRSFSDHWVDSYDESKSFKIIFPCRSVRSYISLFIGRTIGISFPLANLPSIESACHQFVPHCVSNFNYRVWRDFRTSQHISGLEYIFRSKTLCLFSVLFIVESYNTVFVHHVQFLLSVRWYDRGEHCLIISPSAFQLFLNRCNKS